MTDAGDGTTCADDNVDRVISVIGPAFGEAPQVTPTPHDAFGRAGLVTQPDGRSVTRL